MIKKYQAYQALEMLEETIEEVGSYGEDREKEILAVKDLRSFIRNAKMK